MKMRVEVIKEAGYEESLYGLGLSYGLTSDIMQFEFRGPLFEKVRKASLKLYDKDEGHNKFLESMQVWIYIDAPRYWWQEFDTYRVGTSKQSESTIHTIMQKEVTQDNFNEPIKEETLVSMNLDILQYKMAKLLNDEESMLKYFRSIKTNLPEGYLQARVVNTNYKVLRNIFSQRNKHKLEEWKYFIKTIYDALEYNVYLQDLFKKGTK